MAKSDLALSYAMKRRRPKKMADGGPVLPGAESAQASMRKAFGKKYADGGMVENEDLHPDYEPRDEVKDEMLDQYKFSHQKQSHGQLPQPARDDAPEDRQYAQANSPERYSKYSPPGMYPQDFQAESKQDEAYYKDGGFVKAGMSEDREMADELDESQFVEKGQFNSDGNHPQTVADKASQVKAHLKSGGILKAVLRKRMAKGGLMEDDGTQPAESHDVYPKHGYNETGKYDMDRDEFMANQSGDYDFDRHPHAWDKFSEDEVNYAEGGEVTSPKSKRKAMISRLMMKHGA